MPNCFEAGITFYGAAMLGVVLVPIVHFYGPKEVNHIRAKPACRRSSPPTASAIGTSG